ncbi:DUF4249 domain-containing protein [Maribacter aestuarii]|uniref:DUF4249 domain-containing protein n=1 Tax=Maribacter aestuarii TaxID=1130723 RepID=UPI00248AB308|nr:DUF4249 domain-containing protein [Maribacter aestuarii]
MQDLHIKLKYVIVLSVLTVVCCTEPFDIPKTKTEGILVVDARITNENKQQVVRLSRTVPLDSNAINGEAQAQVLVSDDLGNEFRFNESESGTYLSDANFAVVPGRVYELKVETSDGWSYSSQRTQAPPAARIDRLYAEKGIRDSLEQGVFIYVDNDEPANGPFYYKYEYEETYKVFAPYWVPEEAYLVNFDPTISGAVPTDVRPKMQEEQVCYPSVKSKRIIQGNTAGLTGNSLEKFPVRFVAQSNYILAYHYTILVRQYVQSPQAYTYYETLAKLSSVENVFSQIQTGFFEGNITSDVDVLEPVLGYFEVASVDEQRIFFDYGDIFPGERRPNFPFLCEFQAPLRGLRSAIEFEILEFYDYNDPPDPQYSEPGPYIMVPRVCGDCTVLGSNVIPDFWTE